MRLLCLGALFVVGPITNKPKAGPYHNLDYCRVLRASTKGNAACDVITDIIPVQTHATERTGYPQVYRSKQKALFSHAEMKDMLLDQWGPKGVLQCWGCEFSLPDTPRNRRYFDFDHINPKSGGGTNHLDNRAVLCGPCNGQKSDKLTLVALRIEVYGSRKQANAHPIDLKQTTEWARTQEIEALLAREREKKPLFTQ